MLTHACMHSNSTVYFCGTGANQYFWKYRFGHLFFLPLNNMQTWRYMLSCCIWLVCMMCRTKVLVLVWLVPKCLHVVSMFFPQLVFSHMFFFFRIYKHHCFFLGPTLVLFAKLPQHALKFLLIYYCEPMLFYSFLHVTFVLLLFVNKKWWS